MLAESVRLAARRFGDRAAIVAAHRRPTSYRDLDRLSDDVAAGMARTGVTEGAVVALTLPSVPAYVVAYAAAAKLGAITAGVNTRLTERERAALVEMVEPALVVESEDHVAALRSSGDSHGDVPVPPSDPGRPVAIVFTSGTTGMPRGAVFDGARLAAVCEVDAGPHLLGDPAGWRGGGPMIPFTEFAHVGFTTKLPWYLRAGTTLLLMERWRADDVIRLAAEHRVRGLGGVPPQFALMLRSPVFTEVDLSSVETVTLGGGPASPSLRREVIEGFGARLSVRFSSTESGGAGTGTAYDAPEEETLYTEGRPRGPIRLAVRDSEGRDVPTGEVGEVCLLTPTAMVGYWRDSRATARAFWPDGFVRTGDLGRVDETGCLRLAGRDKEMYVRGGYNVYPMEVERVMSRHPGVAEAVVVPRTDDVMGEVGVAVVVPVEPAAPPTLDDLRSFAATSLARHKLPEDLLVVDELPLTAMQKVDRAELARWVAERSARSS